MARIKMVDGKEYEVKESLEYIYKESNDDILIRLTQIGLEASRKADHQEFWQKVEKPILISAIQIIRVTE